jgi:DNA polymerase I-like protein with 3'-5' exonuclease and polymerase domains
MLHDTRIMAGFVDEYESSGLKHSSKLYLDYAQATYDDVTGGRPMNDLTGLEVLRYGCDDTICTAALYRRFKLLMDYEGSWNAYEVCAQKAQFMYAEAFLNGVKFDLNKLEELQEENSNKYIELEAKIKSYLSTLDGFPGNEFIPASDLSASEIKRVYTSVTGKPLATTMRRVEKLGELIGGELGDALVNAEDISAFNAVAAQLFIPSPEISLRSPKQMSELLYDYLGFPVRITNKLTDVQRSNGQTVGNPASNESAIKHCIVYDADENQKDFLLNLLSAKSCLTEDSLFYAPYKNFPSWIDGLVHPQSGQALAKSGRANASKPNFQQISKKSRVREVYVPYDESQVWVSFDFSSQELVHIAVQSGDENLLDCYRGDTRKDVHSLTGVQVLKNTADIDLSYEEFLKVLNDETHELYKQVKLARNQAKATNFLDAYMGSSVTLAESLLVSEDVAQQMLDAKAVAFPDVKLWQEEMTRLHAEREYAVEPMGRRRHLRLDGSWKDSHELRGALNHVIQGGAGSQLTAVLSKLWDRRILEHYNATFLFSVYDEINFSVDKTDAVEFIREVHGVMTEKYADFEISFESSIEIGANFGELKNVGTKFDEVKVRELL